MEYTKGRNLYAASLEVPGYIHATGKSISAASPVHKERTSDWISVEGIEAVTIQCWATIGDNQQLWIGYAFYTSDSMADVIGARTAKYSAEGTGESETLSYVNVAVPEGAKYLRVAYRQYSDGKCKVEYGPEVTGWSPAPEDAVDISEGGWNFMILARNTITLTQIRDIESVTWYYKLQASTASVPAKPTTDPPTGWSTTEPEYTAGSTSSLYICQKTLYTDGTFSYSDVSLSSSYEAAKQAYNKSVAAQTAADNALEKSVEYIVGTQTAATGTWTGVTTDSELRTGKTIAYKLPFAGSGSASLNLTLANGQETGAKAVYTNTTRVTTHFGANSVITMTYDGTYWRANGAAPSNSNTYDRRRHNNAILAETATTADHLIVGTASGYKNLAASATFDLSYPILYADSAIAVTKTATDTYEAMPSVDFSKSGTIQNGVANRMLYLKGSVSGNTFTVAASNYLTTTIPSSADNMYYIPLGVMSSDTAGYFATSNRLYAFLNGAFQAVDTAGVGLANTALTNAAAANALAQSAKNTADGKITTFYAASTAAPTATAIGDLWIKTNDGNSLWRWSGSAWVVVDNADIQNALTAAGTAQVTADSKIITFAQASAPTATDTGDIWIDTNDNNRMYRWNGSTWVDVRDLTIEENATKVTELISDGANLMIGTTYPDASSLATLPRIFGQPDVTHVRSGSILSTAEHGFRTTNSGTGYTFIIFGDTASTGTHQGLNGLIPGETYTISCDITCKLLSNNTNTANYALYVYYYDDHVTTGTLALNKYKALLTITKNDRGVEVSTDERAFFTFEVPEGVTKLYLLFRCSRTTTAEYAAGDFIELRNLKLEKGKVATPWSSPMDWNSKIIAAANGRNKNSYITKSSDGDFDYPSGAVEGDQCFVAEHGSTTYTTLYRFDGTNWVDTKIGGMAVTQLDAGNIATGTLDATKVSIKQLAMYPDGVDNTNPANASFFVDTTPYNATTNPYGGKFFWNMSNSSLSKEGKLALTSHEDDYIHDDDGNVNTDVVPAFLVKLSKVVSPSISEIHSVEIDGDVIRLIFGTIAASVSIQTYYTLEISAASGIAFYEEIHNNLLDTHTRTLLARWTAYELTFDPNGTGTPITLSPEILKRLTNPYFIGAFARSDVGSAPNYDAPGFNGVFEVRPTSETPNETGTKPANGYYPMFTALGGYATLQLAGESVGGKLYWRGNQSPDGSLAGVAWRTILDSETEATAGTITSSHTVASSRLTRDALGNVDLFIGTTTATAAIAKWGQFATIPAGFRPKNTFRVVGSIDDEIVIYAIGSDGKVQVDKAISSGGKVCVALHAHYSVN